MNNGKGSLKAKNFAMLTGKTFESFQRSLESCTVEVYDLQYVEETEFTLESRVLITTSEAPRSVCDLLER